MRIHHGEEPTVITLRLWTYPQALEVVPYLRSLMRSVRENWLALRKALLRIQRLDARRGRANRSVLIEREECNRDSQQAAQRFEETLAELMQLDIYCLDPVGGIAQIPFRVKEELGWFVFDPFAPRPLDAWRLHADPVETRRPLIDCPTQICGV